MCRIKHIHAFRNRNRPVHTIRSTNRTLVATAGFKNLVFFRFFKPKTSRAQFKFLKVFFILCDLINKPHIKILIVICEIHQFHLHFSHGVLLLRSMEFCL